jgi:hypothetical protein
VAHPVHQLAQGSAGTRREVISGMPQIVEVHTEEASAG